MIEGYPILAILLTFLCFLGRSSAVGENCEDYGIQFERVFSVPNEGAMLNSTLISPDVFNHSSVPYNVSWYHRGTGGEMTNETGRTLVLGELLLFLNVTMEDDGDYVCIVRTPSQCYRQFTKLIVDETSPGECGRPNTIEKRVTKLANNDLTCPLTDITKSLKRRLIVYSIRWYKGCVPIEEGGRFTPRDHNAKLHIKDVLLEDSGNYTCTLNFTVAGVRTQISETIDCRVKEDYVLSPRMIEPAGEAIKAELGFSFHKMCKVFVPCVGKHNVHLFWRAADSFILQNDQERVYQDLQQEVRQEDGEKGVWLERVLKISRVEEKDVSVNYTCMAINFRLGVEQQFTLLPADPNHVLSIGIGLTALVVLLIVSLVIYYMFKIDIALCFRTTCPYLYRNTESDGKLYDAYVAYPRLLGGETTREVEMFALHTLPQVLERKCGYKLFILDRDSQPGQAIVDSVEESMYASRRLLLLYTASTFSSSSNPASDKELPETGDQYERVAAMHRALLEGSLQVVLVELEEVSPTQLALFPESVRHLREKQGAVCWWKSQRTKRRWKRYFWRGDENKTAELDISSMCTSSHFWKEMRYHMPVKGKRMACPERNALLKI